MTNPYEPLALPSEPGVVTVVSPPTINKRLFRAFVFSAGCVLGLNLGVAFDEGLEKAVQRTTNDPAGAMVFYVIVSVACVSLFGAWKFLRGRLLSKYYASADTGFASGLLLTFVTYSLAIYAERSRVTGVGVLFFFLIATTFIVVEIQAFVTRFRNALG